MKLSIGHFLLQFAVLFAPFVHVSTEKLTPALYRGSDPSISDIRELHDKGFKTIISMRTNPQKKKQELCERLGMKWVFIKTGVFKTPSDEQLDQFRQVVNDPERQPVYVSCVIGMDRCGAYLGAYRMVDQGWTPEQVKAEFKKHHLKRWWPIFLKYLRVDEEYAATHEKPAVIEAASTSAAQPAEADRSQGKSN